MSVIFKGIDEPKACYTVEGNTINPAIMPCKFYDMCNKRVKEAGYRPNDCPVQKVTKDIEDLIANKGE